MTVSIIVFYLDWPALAAENDLPYAVVSDNPVVVHDGDEARLSDSVQWDGEHEGFVEDGFNVFWWMAVFFLFTFRMSYIGHTFT